QPPVEHALRPDLERDAAWAGRVRPGDGDAGGGSAVGRIDRAGAARLRRAGGVRGIAGTRGGLWLVPGPAPGALSPVVPVDGPPAHAVPIRSTRRRGGAPGAAQDGPAGRAAMERRAMSPVRGR